MIAPFWVERATRPLLVGSGMTYVTTWAIKRVGDGTVCWCHDVTYAYRLVDLLNEDEAHSAAGSPSP